SQSAFRWQPISPAHLRYGGTRVDVCRARSLLHPRAPCVARRPDSGVAFRVVGATARSRSALHPQLSLSSLSGLFLPLIFLGTASGQFLRPAASRLLLSRFLPNGTGPSHKASACLGSSGLSLLGAPGKWGKKKEINFMSYLNSATIIGFVGADPEQRQARNNNGSKFTVLSVATQRSWKNTDDEWASKTEWHRVCVFRPRLAEYVATTIKK